MTSLVTSHGTSLQSRVLHVHRILTYVHNTAKRNSLPHHPPHPILSLSSFALSALTWFQRPACITWSPAARSLGGNGVDRVTSQRSPYSPFSAIVKNMRLKLPQKSTINPGAWSQGTRSRRTHWPMVCRTAGLKVWVFLNQLLRLTLHQSCWWDCHVIYLFILKGKTRDLISNFWSHGKPKIIRSTRK